MAVPANISSIVFIVNSYSGETFSGIPSAFCNVVDNNSGSEIARYNLSTDGRAYKGFIIAKVYRTASGWSFSAIGESYSGRQRTVYDIEPQARNYAFSAKIDDVPVQDSVQDDIDEHIKRYQNAKADRDGCLETIKESEATMNSVVEYLQSEYDMSEEDINQ